MKKEPKTINLDSDSDNEVENSMMAGEARKVSSCGNGNVGPGPTAVKGLPMKASPSVAAPVSEGKAPGIPKQDANLQLQALVHSMGADKVLDMLQGQRGQPSVSPFLTPPTQRPVFTPSNGEHAGFSPIEPTSLKLGTAPDPKASPPAPPLAVSLDTPQQPAAPAKASSVASPPAPAPSGIAGHPNTAPALAVSHTLAKAPVAVSQAPPKQLPVPAKASTVEPTAVESHGSPVSNGAGAAASPSGEGSEVLDEEMMLEAFDLSHKDFRSL